MRTAVLGLGSWGTAIAIHLADGGHEVAAWTLEEGDREAVRRDRENRRFLPGARVPDGVTIVDEPVAALAGAEAAVLAVPSFAVRDMAKVIAGAGFPGPVINVAKGLEKQTRKRMLEVLADELGDDAPAVSLVGPSHAEEVALRYPTAVVAASRDAAAAELTQHLFSDESFRVYTNDDVVGVELAVALKNVIALAAGISAGLGYGDNTLGALLTRGLAEMTRLGLARGARPETFFGLAGVGDLITTSVSRHSRNRRVGEAIGRGRTLDEVMAKMDMVAEGVHTARAARDLARESGVEMPIVERVSAILFENEDPRAAITALMTREPKAEDPTPTPSSRGSE